MVCKLAALRERCFVVGKQREETAVVAFALSKPLRDYGYFTINFQDYYRMLRIRHLASNGKYSSVVGNRSWLVYYIYRRPSTIYRTRRVNKSATTKFMTTGMMRSQLSISLTKSTITFIPGYLLPISRLMNLSQQFY